jgi:hypothetical protein
LKNKRYFWFSIVVLLSVGLVISTIFAPIVQARDVEAVLFEEPAVPASSPKATQAAYNPAAYAEVWGITPDMLVNCDPDGTLLANTDPGSAQTFRKLQTKACRQQTLVDTQAATAQAGVTALNGCASCGSSGVSGETTQLKIAGITTEVRYVYMQCGKKVGELSPPTCSCGSNVYTYTCKRPPTVYITIPCYHH